MLIANGNTYYVSHYGSALSKTQIRAMRKVAKIMAYLMEAAKDTSRPCADFRAIGQELDRIILEHTVGGKPPTEEP